MGQSRVLNSRYRFSIIILVAAILISTSSYAFLEVTADHFPNLILNGDFETGPPVPVGPAGFVSLFPGDTTITGWTVGAGTGTAVSPNFGFFPGVHGIDYIDSSKGSWVSSSGDNSMDLSHTDTGTISQTLTTTTGLSYEVTFDMAGNPGPPTPSSPVTKNLRVSAAGDSTDYTFDTTGKSNLSMGWTEKSFTFSATSSSTTLTFASLDNTPFGPALDNVSVKETNHPPTANAQTVNTNEDTNAIIELTGADTETSSSSLTFSVDPHHH